MVLIWHSKTVSETHMFYNKLTDLLQHNDVSIMTQVTFNNTAARYALDQTDDPILAYPFTSDVSAQQTV